MDGLRARERERRDRGGGDGTATVDEGAQWTGIRFVHGEVAHAVAFGGGCGGKTAVGDGLFHARSDFGQHIWGGVVRGRRESAQATGVFATAIFTEVAHARR